MKLDNYRPPLARYRLPLETDAERGRMQKQLNAFKAQTESLQEITKPDRVYWPTRTASDRQLVEVGVPFERKGEMLVLERTIGGALRSRRYLGVVQQKHHAD